MHDSTPAARYRLGRRPNAGRPRIRLTAESLLRVAAVPPPSVDHYSHVPARTWNMDHNDTVGDCTCAEVDHAIKAMQVAAGNPEIRSDPFGQTLYQLGQQFALVTGLTNAVPAPPAGHP